MDLPDTLQELEALAVMLAMEVIATQETEDKLYAIAAKIYRLEMAGVES